MRMHAQVGGILSFSFQILLAALTEIFLRLQQRPLLPCFKVQTDPFDPHLEDASVVVSSSIFFELNTYMNLQRSAKK